MTSQDYQWIGGFDNSGTLVNIETDLPSFQGITMQTSGLGNTTPGLFRRRFDGLITVTGFKTVEWVFSAMTIEAWNYIQDTYTAGGAAYAAPMTIRTTLEETGDTYFNMNAIMTLPIQAGLTRTSEALQGVVLSFRIDGVAA